LTDQPPAGKQGPEVVTETLRVMGKGVDHIVIQRLSPRPFE
jgi:hypothetical protein